MNSMKWGIERLLALALMSLVAAAATPLAAQQAGEKLTEEMLIQQTLQRIEQELKEQAPPSSSTGASQVQRKDPGKIRMRHATAQAGTMKCLPTCNTSDGRFLAIASNLVTLSETDLDLQVSVPADIPSFQIGVFDGDGRDADGSGMLHWDTGFAALFEYTLWADPNGDGTGAVPVELLPGVFSVMSNTLPDNAWFDFTVVNDPSAQSPSGNYFYRLNIRAVTPSIATVNAFKLRTTAILSGITLDPVARPFSYIANVATLADLQMVYPAFPSVTPSTYDGSFSFFFDLPTSRQDLALWDGDFDRGKFDGTEPDTDDPDTPNAPFLPDWATLDTLPEGISLGIVPSTGNPPDDRNPAGNAVYLAKSPSVRYELLAPDGRIFANENPSGNQEWEQFRISTEPFDPAQMDFSTPSLLPPGTYQLRAVGVDMANLNALLLPYRVVCVDEDGVPCVLLRPFKIGDRVFLDNDGNGEQGDGEPGIPGVVLEMVDANGFVVTSATTDDEGAYSFGVERGSYTVRVAAENFEPDGPLAGTVSTTGGEERTDTVVDNNLFDYDFGYRGTASLGDRVWEDTDGDGVQDDGEAGLEGVTVHLLDGDGNVLASTTTADGGQFSFTGLSAGTYTVQVDSATLPAGSTATYDFDGVDTPGSTEVTLGAGEERVDIDFGYQPAAGSIGDRIWNDTDGNGAQNTGEAGLNGVTVQLIDTNGNVVATQVTSGDGNYRFDDLEAGIYTVQVVAATLPAGSTQTYDLDGLGSPNRASINVDAGQELTNVDFGYRQANSSIGDRLWYDTDGDGAQDAGEPGLEGTAVQLLNGSGSIVATTTAGANGVYSFNNLTAGTYTVRVVTSTFPVGGLSPTFDADGTGTAHTATVTLAGGQTRNDVDFGYRGTQSIGDRVWNDADGDGTQDSGEAGINGVTVRLFLGSVEVFSTVTAGNGNYSFPNLPETTFTVRIDTATLPAGMTPTYDLDGVGTPHQTTVNLTASRSDVDFGYQTPPVSCTAGYFKDDFSSASFSNNNGTLSWAGAWIESDSAGTGVSSGNVTVGHPYGGYLFLRDYPDTGTQPSAARQANLAGFASATLSFSFHVRTAVDPSDAVTVEVSKDGGATYTVLEILDGFSGTDEATRSYNISAYIASNFRVRFRVTNGYGASDELFKLDWIKIEGSCAPSQTGSIGNRVWNDADGDGVQDSGEAGLNGVTVQLLNSSGTVIATTATAGNGDYSFGNLAAGNYSVRIVTSTLPAGVTPTFDLDGTGTANIAAVSLTTGQNRTDADFGYRTPPASCTAGYFRDDFSSASFSNNNGTLSWAGAWIESDSAGSGVSSGNVTVGNPYGGYLFLRDYPDTGTQPSAARQANLASFAAATLSFGFHVRTGVDPSDAVTVEVSKDGGATYTVLEVLDGFSGTDEATRSYKISAYIASNFRVRFRVTNGYGASDELFKLDWIKIEGSCTSGQTAEAPGTGTIGYWKNHPEAWPVSSIQIGNKTYTKAQAISLIGTASRGDKTIDLAKQLIAAKLNVLAGNEAGCIISTISAADAWLARYPASCGVKASSSAWSQGAPLHEKLDDYNNGLLCAPHRD